VRRMAVAARMYVWVVDSEYVGSREGMCSFGFF
jgi:hypothetical protein